jgi:hypothetical protein
LIAAAAADAAVFSINVAATAHAALQGFAFTAGRQETLTAMIEGQVRARLCVYCDWWNEMDGVSCRSE